MCEGKKFFIAPVIFEKIVISCSTNYIQPNQCSLRLHKVTTETPT